MMMENTQITCIDTGVSVNASILTKTSKSLRVAIENTNIPISLHKNTPNDRYYKGSFKGMEFISTGN